MSEDYPPTVAPADIAYTRYRRSLTAALHREMHRVLSMVDEFRDRFDAPTSEDQEVRRHLAYLTDHADKLAEIAKHA